MLRSIRRNALLGTFFVIIAILTPVYIGLSVYLDRLNTHHAQQEQRYQFTQQAALLRARIEGSINANIQTVLGLKAIIQTNPNMSQTEFASVARHLFEGKSQLRNIGGAPDMIVSLMYPLEGNEAALGLNYRENFEQWVAADRARSTGELVIAGPVTLRQGGEALIGRVPVFLENDQFWGLISAVIDMQAFYEDTGLNALPSNLSIAVRGKDALGELGQNFFGDPDLFTHDSVFTDISLPSGSWQLAVRPGQGWLTQAPNTQTLRTLLFFVGMLLLIPAFSLYRLLVHRAQHEATLIHAKNEAVAAANAKSDFLAMMSHEIRTPLNGITSMLSLLQRGPIDDKQVRKVAIARQNADALLNIIDDILDFTKIDAGHLNIANHPFSPELVAQGVIDVLQPRSGNKDVRIHLDTHNLTVEQVIGDASRVRQVLMNLVGNAVKFTEEGMVLVQCSTQSVGDGKARLVFRVEDSGIGIPPEKQATLFDPFTQADTSSTRAYGGTGLGLAISKRLCDLMDGSIAVRSVPGKGSVFSFHVVVDEVPSAANGGPANLHGASHSAHESHHVIRPSPSNDPQSYSRG